MMNNQSKTLAYKISMELFFLISAILIAATFFSIYYLKGFANIALVIKLSLICSILIISICYVTFRVVTSYVKPVKILTEKILNKDAYKNFILSQTELKTLEISNLFKALNISAENHKEYQTKLQEEVWTRTMELEDYKVHLEQMVEEQTKDIRLAKMEAERANRAKSEFLANMSHEFRTPMHAIISFSSLGLEKKADLKTEKALKYFENINSSGKRLMNLINDLLDLSKLETGVMSLNIAQANFVDAVNQVLDEVSSLTLNKKLLIISSINATNVIINCDIIRITQVIMNLFSNAIKFSPEQGEVSYEVSNFVQDDINYLKFVISDCGIGIPEAELETIFDKFVQSSKTSTGAGGSGLGLSICKMIIDSHNGKIWAENNISTGAKFTFILPV